MDVSRAKEIIEREENCNILFDGTQVIIDDVYETTNMARVHSTHEPEKDQVVPLHNLLEG
ncbi:H-type small acid-soluble spore protein [Cytobacillus purgationiresistens]|uniref:Small, acid-soluble spore protein H n=1 Tax=Cytobacillus purgationiresistens TaxID=863449 RepID=A0ABU0AAW1_9BACI|nr:H-type small acid-soluble spore protein [Cytobacillus purgationiresistens]MDQ0268388.1 H-type small acid-soluble spore protein [Cytobacillus purgationiresistens]